jgi:hypothetical protein
MSAIKCTGEPSSVIEVPAHSTVRNANEATGVMQKHLGDSGTAIKLDATFYPGSPSELVCVPFR